jgi:hypothetical protein
MRWTFDAEKMGGNSFFDINYRSNCPIDLQLIYSRIYGSTFSTYDLVISGYPYCDILSLVFKKCGQKKLAFLEYDLQKIKSLKKKFRLFL